MSKANTEQQDFHKRVACVCRMLPRGMVATYGQVALLCEKPQNARQVGHALGRKVADDVPAHRIINHQGYLSGAAAFGHPDIQNLYLEEEGVAVSFDTAKQKYRVDLKAYMWQPGPADIGMIKALFRELGI